MAPLLDGIEGLGALGNGAHSPSESVSLPALVMQPERVALLLDRRSREKADAVRRKPKV